MAKAMGLDPLQVNALARRLGWARWTSRFRAVARLYGSDGVLVAYEIDRQNFVFTYTDTSPEGWWDPRVVLAYSGGLDTSVAVRWMVEELGVEVIALAADESGVSSLNYFADEDGTQGTAVIVSVPRRRRRAPA